jgi:hypothetical protein
VKDSIMHADQVCRSIVIFDLIEVIRWLGSHLGRAEGIGCTLEWEVWLVVTWCSRTCRYPASFLLLLASPSAASGPLPAVHPILVIGVVFVSLAN